jgi:hypothetical protein
LFFQQAFEIIFILFKTLNTNLELLNLKMQLIDGQIFLIYFSLCFN